jgi:hypothetical protein
MGELHRALYSERTEEQRRKHLSPITSESSKLDFTGANSEALDDARYSQLKLKCIYIWSKIQG